MMTALCSGEDAGPKAQRYWAAVVSGVLVIVFGLLSGVLIAWIVALPAPFISIVTGFTLLGVLLNSLRSAFSETSYRYSTLFAFVVSAANVSFFGIAAPVWSLVAGMLTARWLKEGKRHAESGT